ncbi:Oidioi.mRNA.OKI2018_I69.XSR.g15955.t1.cds [Oikopleura dioica]|uniref:Oidioi.mRNA.OKI2018_I69.XSR.g15955.t1.cds n=1 Tax=Oikopleura dioica TaxID=34765 RepID=A0ABN7SJL4_OIKDI|nr:Oidioi.mRNA.OKI2018_I69.XSR.g15955.t1.cds [Oikopleura dioica]
MAGREHEKGIPKKFLIDQKESTFKNTCVKCGHIPRSLYVHFIPKYVQSLRQAEECRRRFCDACLPENYPDSICSVSKCSANIKRGSKALQRIENDISRLVFSCLSTKCKQFLTYDDFGRHSHDIDRSMNKNNKSRTGIPNDSFDSSKGNKVKNPPTQPEDKMYPPLDTFNSKDEGTANSKDEDYSNDNPSIHFSNPSPDQLKYPSKNFEEGQFSYINGNYTDQCPPGPIENTRQHDTVLKTMKNNHSSAKNNKPSEKRPEDVPTYNQEYDSRFSPIEVISTEQTSSYAMDTFDKCQASMQNAFQNLMDGIESLKRESTQKSLAVRSDKEELKDKERQIFVAKNETKKLNERVDELVEIIRQQSGEIDSLKQDQSNATEKILMIESSKTSAEHELIDCQDQLREAYKQIEAQSTLMDSLKRYKEERDELRNKFTDLKENARGSEKAYKDELKNIHDRLDKKYDELASEKENSKRYKDERDHLRKEYNHLKTAHEQTEKFRDLLNDQNERLKEEIAYLKKQKLEAAPRETQTHQQIAGNTLSESMRKSRRPKPTTTTDKHQKM